MEFMRECVTHNQSTYSIPASIPTDKQVRHRYGVSLSADGSLANV